VPSLGRSMSGRNPFSCPFAVEQVSEAVFCKLLILMRVFCLITFLSPSNFSYTSLGGQTRGQMCFKQCVSRRYPISKSGLSPQFVSSQFEISTIGFTPRHFYLMAMYSMPLRTVQKKRLPSFKDKFPISEDFRIQNDTSCELIAGVDDLKCV
jgi:hypothetical protein